MVPKGSIILFGSPPSIMAPAHALMRKMEFFDNVLFFPSSIVNDGSYIL